MSAIRITNATLGTGVVREQVPGPIAGTRWAERVGIRWSGLVDRFRTREVADTELTHYLHRLTHDVRRREAEVVVVTERCLALLLVRAAQAGIVAGTEVGAAPEEPTLDQLADLEDGDRAEWARGVRAAREAAAATRAAAAAASTARLELVEIAAEREAVLNQSAAVRVLWAEAFAIRAAFYQRARHGLFGRRTGPRPDIPRYRPTTGHADTRDLGPISPA